MARSLVRWLIEGHTDSSPAGSAIPSMNGREDVCLRIRHVCMDLESAALALLALKRLPVTRRVCEAAWIWSPPASRGSIGGAGGEEAFVRRGAVESDISWSGPEEGLGLHVCLERLASPGKILLGTGSEVGACGALGMIGLTGGPVQLALALAGVPLYRPYPRVIGLELHGELPRWTCGEDVYLYLKQRGIGEGTGPVILEACGPGIAGMSFAERVGLARRAEALGAQTLCFPADETAREALRAQRREADWKPIELEGDPAFDAQIPVELATLEPLIEPPLGRSIRPLRELVGRPVSQVVIGPEASLSDLLRVARHLDRPVAGSLRVMVVPGSRQIAERAREQGVLTRLLQAGVRLLPPGSDPGDVLGEARGTLLSYGWRCGDRWREVAHQAGPDACAATALSGRLADPRGLDWDSAGWKPNATPAEVVDLRSSAAPAGAAVPPGAPETRASEPDPPPDGPPLEGPLRGVILAILGDYATAASLLSSGPRLDRLRLRPARLADHVLAVRDPSFAGRARRQGPSLVLGGRELGGGPMRPGLGFALVELGVRAVIADSYAPAFRRELMLHGIQPLLFSRAEDRAGLAIGHELEMPDLPEGLLPHQPVVARDLTGGTQVALGHDLRPWEIETLCCGGGLGHARRLLAERAGPSGSRPRRAEPAS